MSEIVDQSLRKITRGAILVFGGTAAGMLFGLVSRMIITRYVTQGEYGLYSLAFVVISIAVVVSVLGIDSGSSRQIGFYRGKGDESKIRAVVISSLQIPVLFSILLALLIFFIADFISTRLLHTPELAETLKIFCIAIPFLVLINILTAIFRGFDKAEPNIYFQGILRNALFPLLLIVVIFFSLPFIGVVYAFVASIVLTSLVFIVYTIRKLPLESTHEVLSKRGIFHFSLTTRELLLFSLPLFSTTIINSIMGWMDTLILGFYKLPADVGLYNAALPLVNLISTALFAASFLYVPLMTQLYAKNQIDEVKRSYIVITKWILAVTLPVSLVLILFPGAALNILFGPLYVDAASALQILAIGFFFHSALGSNFYTLLVMGETRFLMWSTSIALVCNIVLNIVLIPPFGIVGAAIATSATRIVNSLFWSIKLYALHRMHPITWNYLKPAIAAVCIALIIFLIVRNVFTVIPIWLIVLLFILFFGGYALSVLLTKSFDREDIELLLALEKALGMDLALIKKILKRFL